MMLVIISLISLSIQGIVPVLTGISILHLFSISFLGIGYISKGLKSKPNKKGTKEGTKEYAIPFKVLSSFHYAMDCISFITYTCLHQHV